MRWRRFSSRLGDTETPATPYQRAGQLWDQRIGSARVQAANWRLMAFGCLALAAVVTADDIRTHARAMVTPFVVEVDHLGAVQAVAPARTEVALTDTEIAYFLAQVTQDVYDSATGRTLLVPQGAKLIGKYDSVVAYGQSRVLLIWTRLIMPDGSSVVLDNLPGADTQGYAGLEDGVDYHFWRLLRGVALSSLLGVSSALAANNVAGGTGTGNVIIALGQSADQAANQAGQSIVSRDLGVQPTLTVRPGFPLDVMVNRDIVLRPYGGG